MFSVRVPTQEGTNESEVQKSTVDIVPQIDIRADKKSLSSALEKIKTILQNGQTQQKLECVERIMLSVFSDSSDTSKKYEKALVRTKVFDAVVNLIKVEDYSDLLFKDKTTCDLSIGTLQCTMNVTNYYADVGKSIAEADGIRYITDICRHKPFLDKMDDENVYSLLIGAVATLHNIGRLSPVQQYFIESKTAQALVPFIDAKDERLQIYATLGAAQTCEDDEIHTIDCKGVIVSVLKYIKKACDSMSHSYGGGTITELLDGMDKLACADPNKKKILDAGALPIFIDVLKLDNPEEQALTARVLWTISFDDDVAREIKSAEDLMELVMKLSKSSDNAVRNNMKGLLYNLDRLDKKVEDQKPSKPTQKHTGHVFISYCWKEKEIVLKLKDLLQKEGVNTWIDTEKMRGSTLQAMAEAVENASLVLICMSEHYKHSPNCRLESENTFRLQKDYIPLMVQKYYKPDGWLGALLGTKLYIDFSGKYAFEPKWNELIKELHTIGILEQGTNGVEKSTVVKSSPLPPLPPSQPKLKTKLSTPADVRHWLTVNNLVKCCQHFEDVNGEGLMQLKYMRHDAPEFYFRTLSKKLKLSLGEILNLTAALEKL